MHHKIFNEYKAKASRLPLETKGALFEIFNYPRRILKSADMKGFQRYFLG